MFLVWCFRHKKFIVDYVFCDVFCILFFRLFLLVVILFFVIVHFVIIAFLLFILVLVDICFFFPEYLPTIFLDISRFVAVFTFWYVRTFFIPVVFFLVTIFPESRAGTLVLGFYIEVFSIFYWSSWSWLFVHLVKKIWNVVTDPLNS